MPYAILTSTGRLLCQPCYTARLDRTRAPGAPRDPALEHTDAFEITPDVLDCQDCGEGIH